MSGNARSTAICAEGTIFTGMGQPHGSIKAGDWRAEGPIYSLRIG